MSGNEIPTDAPPSYQTATGSSRSSSSRPANISQTHDGHLSIGKGHPQGANGISVSSRRSMEDELRPLPKGWVRSFDPESKHQFFVDTRQDPPRSIWMHPYDDEEYLRTLSSDERKHIEQESMNRGHVEPSKADIMASHTDDEDDEQHLHRATSSSSSTIPGELPPRPERKGKGRDGRSFGRKWKDKITGSSHEQREAERKRRAEEEQKQYERHQALRIAMAKAAETGKPQFVGTDKNGKDIYVDPPGMQMGPAGYGVNAPGSGYSGGYGGGYGGGYPYGGGYGYGGGYSPYGYARPAGPYRRPYGGGYGGGYGLPLALGGGLLGGLLIGDALGVGVL